MKRNSAHIGPLSPEYAILGLLTQGPSHGYELYQILHSDLGQVWHISLSQAYNILKRLEGSGLIASEVLPQEKLPDRKLFKLTHLGEERFNRWLKSSSPTSVRSIRLEFLTRLYFGRSRGLEFTRQLIDDQLAEVQTGLEQLKRLSHQIPEHQVINHLSIDLRFRQLESIKTWLEECHRIIL